MGKSISRFISGWEECHDIPSLVETVRLLLRWGADPGVRDEQGRNVLHVMAVSMAWG